MLPKTAVAAAISAPLLALASLAAIAGAISLSQGSSTYLCAPGSGRGSTGLSAPRA